MKLKQKPNGIYYIDTQLPDDSGQLKRARVSFDTRDKAAAQAQLRDWLAGVHPKHPAQGGVIAAKGREARPEATVSRMSRPTGMTVNRWLDRCLTTLWGDAKAAATHKSNVRILTRILPDDLLLADLTSTHVYELRRGLEAGDHGTSYAAGSVKKLLGTLSSACNHATDPEPGKGLNPETGKPYLETAPRFPAIAARNVKSRVLSHDEEVALFECIEARTHAEPLRQWRKFKRLALVLLDTGFRLSEGLQLGQRSVKRKRWMDKRAAQLREKTYVGLDRYTTKNDRPREVPVSARLEALIPELNAEATNGRWFPWPEGSSGPGYMLDCIRQDMKARGYDIDDVTLHTFRHTCATRLADNGMDLLTLRDWLGHSDIKITAERYVHLMTSHLYVGAEILDMLNAPVPSTGETGSGSGEGPTIRIVSSNGGNRAMTGTDG